MATFEFILTLIVELIPTILSIIIIRTLLQKNKLEFIGNKLLALSLFFVGTYTFLTFLYTIIAKAAIIDLFLLISFLCILTALILLYFTIQVVLHSSMWLQGKEKWIWIILTAAIFIMMISTDFITVVDEAQAITVFDPVVYYIYAGFVLFVLLFSSIQTYRVGIKRIDDAKVKKKMVFFFLALICLIFSLIVDTIGGLVEVGEIFFDIGLFGLISIALLLMERAMK